MHEQNAIIKSAKITAEDHGMLTVWLELDYGGCFQGFGGYNLHSISGDFKQCRANVCGHFVWRVMEVAGVYDWSDVAGKCVRVRREDDNFSAKVLAIGHIIKDDWFNPKKDFSEIEMKGA